ncbi:ubiquitin-ligase zinc ion binding [Micractinium conductrix]|uniref:Ubiquitin-ligase zinc ion binding n=1 Tax=Micractinium conductrix TaxID=554055 RepID=A0A2P6VGT3_9CHLO|nr:ubiquitin-ligase zinc ion binding [Micractinium conductrix]|eukprot:PSC73301.1 ubiquitin-ligase zinc ion binding [Micractinium conductrix]
MSGNGEALSAMEAARMARIAENRRRLQELGVVDAMQAVAATQGTAAAAQRRERLKEARASQAARRAASSAGAPERRMRRSERVAGIETPNYCENERMLLQADGAGQGGGRDRRLMRENMREEVYGVAHLDALGSHKQEWELFVDGYDAKGERIYDKVNGQTCHQCRQKTMGKRTCCAGCQSLTGVLCGDCLFMRYGENVDEATADPDWRCPLCRDLCNCSFHRSKRGWAPTGTLYRRAIAEGYTSVSHYLVLNSLSDEAKPVALERGLCPPELAAELKKEIAEGKKAAPAPVDLPAPAAVPAAEQPPAAAVDAQLLQLDGEAEPAPACRAARGGRAAAAAKGKQQQEAVPAPAAAPAPAPRKRKQAILDVVSVRPAAAAAAGQGKKQQAEGRGGGKGAGEEPARRGLRSSARVAA